MFYQLYHSFLSGQSGSGKTTLSKSILASIAPKGRPVLVLNDHTKQELDHGWRRIGFEHLKDISHCALVVEDVLSATKQEFTDLKECLHFSVHHR